MLNMLRDPSIFSSYFFILLDGHLNCVLEVFNFLLDGHFDCVQCIILIAPPIPPPFF